MSWPSKILPFRKPVRDPVKDDVQPDDDAFPRFRKELDRPAALIGALVSGFAVPPRTGK